MRRCLIEIPKTKYNIGKERTRISADGHIRGRTYPQTGISGPIATVLFSMEYRELLRTLDNDESVRTFMDGKLNERGEMAQVRYFRGSSILVTTPNHFRVENFDPGVHGPPGFS